jgi:acetyltransferase-like isoleucine patch superfamily enzyme
MQFLKETVKELFFRPSGVTFGEGSYIRRPYSISGRKCVKMGSRTLILGGLHIEAIAKYAGVTYWPMIEIGSDVYIGGSAYLTAVNRISIGDGCVLSEHVYITDEIHGIDPKGGPIMKQPLINKGPVTIGRACFLGFRTAVMPGVTLGEHCVVGANSTVTRSFPAYSMIGGSPARLLKRYSQELGQWVSPDQSAE